MFSQPKTELKTESKQTNDNSKMMSICIYEDAHQFSGRVVAFKTSSVYLGANKGYRIDSKDVGFAFIGERMHYWGGSNEAGYTMSILLKPKEVHSTHALTTADLKEAEMQMRLASTEELRLIKEVVNDSKAEFEYNLEKVDKAQIIEILNGAINKLENKSTRLSM